MQQQQKWQRNATSQTTNKSNDKTPETSHNYLLQHYCLTSSTRKIRTRLSFCKRNVPREIKTKCSSRRKDFPFLAILGKSHKRSGNFRNSQGIQNSLVKDTSPGKNSYEYIPKRQSKISNGKRDQRNVGEESNEESLATQRSACSKSISEQSFPYKEKRCGLLSGYKSENYESVCTLYALQNGKFPDFDEGKRLHVQNRFEGRLFYSVSRQIMSSFSEIFMGRESLPITVSLFWSRTSPSSFYQNFDSPNIPFAPSIYQNFDLPGRHFVNASINRETSSCKIHRNLSPSTFGICNKLKNVSHGTGTNSRIYKPCDKFDSNYSFLNRRETERNFTGIQNNIFNK